jgi:hypothetical protein
VSKTKPVATKKRELFLVVRMPLAGGHRYGCYPIIGQHENDMREVPVRAFAKKADAEAYARELDAEVRAHIPLPLLAEVIDRFDRLTDNALSTRLPALLAEHGMPPITFGRRPIGVEFREWWAKHAADLSADQRAALWEPFAGMTFHWVKQIEVEG